ncbi:hypothetical protein HK102_001489 [Quaeritorhiza haematococci]|nr:hypothetical protein HK102_001489 [Quaeritorhiza haematococci]
MSGRKRKQPSGSKSSSSSTPRKKKTTGGGAGGSTSSSLGSQQTLDQFFGRGGAKPKATSSTSESDAQSVAAKGTDVGVGLEHEVKAVAEVIDLENEKDMDDLPSAEDFDEEKAVQQAIRESLESCTHEGNEEEEVRRAIRESLKEVGPKAALKHDRDSVLIVEKPQGTSIISPSKPTPRSTWPQTTSSGKTSTTTAAPPLEKSKVSPQQQEQSPLLDPLKFNPDILPSYWKKGEPTPYKWLSECFRVVDGMTGRIVIADVSFLAFSLENYAQDVWFSRGMRGAGGASDCAFTGRGGADEHASNDHKTFTERFDSRSVPVGIETGIGSQILVKALTSISDMQSKNIKAAWDQKGDWGDVCFAARIKMGTLMRPKPLSVKGVYETLRKIASLKGQGVVDQKTGLVKKMMVACQGEEVRYLARTLVSNLRIGAVRTTILAALSHACVMEIESARDQTEGTDSKGKGKLGGGMNKETLKARFKVAEGILKTAFAQTPNYDILVPQLLDPEIGLGRIAEVCKCTPGVPIRPMLGKITRDLSEVFEKLEGLNFAADFKYDGQRAQIHLDESGKITIFSRHLERMTDKYPDICEVIPQICQSTSISPAGTSSSSPDSASSFILDAEVVAVEEVEDNDPSNSDAGEKKKTFQTLPFQTLSNRGRKNVSIEDVKIRVCVFGFDLMYLNGRSLLREPFRVRRDLMRSAFREIPGRFAFVPQLETNDPDQVDEFLKKSLNAGCEGLMVKILDHPPPEKQQRGQQSVLLATYEPDKRSESWLKVKKDYVDSLADSFDLVPIGAWYGNGRKAGWWSPFLMAAYNPETEMYETVCKCMSGFSDAFYKGMKVWEIRGADLTLSPVHKVASGLIDEDGGRGLSLRFPRFIRAREDKNPEDATTPDQIVEIFRKQRERGPDAQAGGKKDRDDEGDDEGEEEVDEEDEGM